MLSTTNETVTLANCCDSSSCLFDDQLMCTEFEEGNRQLSVIEVIIVWLNVFGNPVVIFVGFTGNGLSLIVFLCTELRRQSTNVYLAFLSIVDLIFLSTLILNWLAWIDVNLVSKQGCCQMTIYFSYVSSFLSVWTVVSFTAERWVVVFYPLRKAVWCTRQRAASILGLLTVIALLLYMFSFWTVATVFDGYKEFCQALPEFFDIYHAMTIVDSMVTFIVPFGLITILNASIAFKIWLVMYHQRASLLTSSSNENTTHPLTSFNNLNKQNANEKCPQNQLDEDDCIQNCRNAGKNLGLKNVNYKRDNSDSDNGKIHLVESKINSSSSISSCKGTDGSNVSYTRCKDSKSQQTLKLTGDDPDLQMRITRQKADQPLLSCSFRNENAVHSVRAHYRINVPYAKKTNTSANQGSIQSQYGKSLYQVQADKRVRQLQSKVTKTLLIISTGKI